MSSVSALSHVQRVRILYKTCLRLHRGLPTQMQIIGDAYVKDEFKRFVKKLPFLHMLLKCYCLSKFILYNFFQAQESRSCTDNCFHGSMGGK